MLESHIDPGVLDVGELSANNSDWATRATVWIGTRDATTPVHFDEMHNFFVQVSCCRSDFCNHD